MPLMDGTTTTPSVKQPPAPFRYPIVEERQRYVREIPRTLYRVAPAPFSGIGGEAGLITDRGVLSAEDIYALVGQGHQMRALALNHDTLQLAWQPIAAAHCRKAGLLPLAVSQTGNAKQNIVQIATGAQLAMIKLRQIVHSSVEQILADEDFIAIVDQIPVCGQTLASNELAYLAGALFSDGYIKVKPTKGTVVFTQKPTEAKAAFIRTVEQYFTQVFGVSFTNIRVKTTIGNVRGRPVSGSVEDRISTRREPAARLMAIRDDITRWVLGLAQEALLHFLAGFVDGDGTLGGEGNARPLHIIVAQHKRNLLEGLALACLRLGIVPQVNNNREAYALRIAEQVPAILTYTQRVKAEFPERYYASKCFSVRALFEDIGRQVNYMGRVVEGVKRNIMFGAETIRRDVLPLCTGAAHEELALLLGAPLRSYRLRVAGEPAQGMAYGFTLAEAGAAQSVVALSSRLTPLLLAA